MLEAWREDSAGEVEGRSGQERARGLMKLVVMAWREETDGRKARSLRGATDWGIQAHAPSRTPTDCLPTDVTMMGPRITSKATEDQERTL